MWSVMKSCHTWCSSCWIPSNHLMAMLNVKIPHILSYNRIGSMYPFWFVLVTRSAGCIFAELANAGRPLFPGSDVDDQIKRVGHSFLDHLFLTQIEQHDSGVQAVGHTHRRHLARDGQSSRLQTFPPLPTLALLRTGGFIRHIHWSTDQNLIFSRLCQNNFCVRWYLNYLAEGATCWADFSSVIQLAGEIFRIFLSRKSFLHFPVFFRLSAAESMNHIYFSDLSQAVKSG